MKKYVLMEDEVALFKGDVKRLDCEYEGMTRAIVTNYYLVLIELETDNDPLVYGHGDIKLYNNKPYIKQKGSTVELYYSFGEEELVFKNPIEAMKFVTKMIDGITGKTLTKRATEKVKETIDVIDETLGIDTIETLKGVAKNGAEMIVDNMAEKDGKKGAVGKVLKGGKDVLKMSIASKKQGVLPPSKTMSLEEKTAMLKQYKDMLDNGIITQEEFDVKKAELLG